MSTLPLLALPCGDPAGIGPELVGKLMRHPALLARARVLALGPACARPAHVPEFLGDDLGALSGLAWRTTPGAGDWQPGRPQASAGHAALAALRAGHELALAGRADALVSAPVSKEALHLAGEKVEGQTELLGRWCGAPGVQMLGLAHELRVLLLTRHMPLVRALAEVTTERVVAHLELLARGLVQLGFTRPRLALAGLNPHAGENGLLGDEEQRLLEPAVQAMRARGIEVAGPVSPDTVFLRAARGEFDGVLALYHDQAFIPLKLHAPGEGLTVLLGLPYLRISPAHGTAFDLVGTGRAEERNLVVALEAALRFAAPYRAGLASR